MKSWDSEKKQIAKQETWIPGYSYQDFMVLLMIFLNLE